MPQMKRESSTVNFFEIIKDKAFGNRVLGRIVLPTWEEAPRGRSELRGDS